jgi:hypothetical protein
VSAEEHVHFWEARWGEYHYTSNDPTIDDYFLWGCTCGEFEPPEEE